MSEAQATVIAALLTVVAAIVGVLLGSVLFGRRVKGMEDAVRETELQVKGFQKAVDDLVETTSSIQESVGNIRGALPEGIPEQASPAVQSQNATDMGEWKNWYLMRDLWNDVREEIERVSADPKIDGRTRAKYARIDKRNYSSLVSALAKDGLLGPSVDSFQGAYNIWRGYKSGRANPQDTDLNLMRNYRDAVCVTGRNM